MDKQQYDRLIDVKPDDISLCISSGGKHYLKYKNGSIKLCHETSTFHLEKQALNNCNRNRKLYENVERVTADVFAQQKRGRHEVDATRLRHGLVSRAHNEKRKASFLVDTIVLVLILLNCF